jgi:hypothetical protein
MVMQLPTDDKLSMNKTEMISRLAILMGGRMAEELKFGAENVTAGAASDIQQATRLARAMITRWGFSDSVGPVDYAEDQGEVFLGNQIVKSSHVSEETSRKIEEEVRKLVVGGLDTARRVLTEKQPEWAALAEGLLEYETLTGDEIKDLLTGKGPSARHEIFYFGESTLGAVRIDDYKYRFIDQPDGWIGSKVHVDAPNLTNLRLDPFERLGNPQNGTLDGAQGFFMEWFVYEFWRFVFVQQEVAKLAMTAIEYPPMQKGASFNLDAVKAKIEEAMKQHAGN